MSVNLELSPMEQRAATIKRLRKQYLRQLWFAIVVELASFALIYWATRSFKMVAALFVFAWARNMSIGVDILKFELKQHEATQADHIKWAADVAQRIQDEQAKQKSEKNP
jgi:hypothetical protein